MTTEEAADRWAQANVVPLAQAMGLGDGPPGVPLHSGFRRLPPDEQAGARRAHRELQKAIEPFITEAWQCRARAAALAQTAFIG